MKGRAQTIYAPTPQECGVRTPTNNGWQDIETAPWPTFDEMFKGVKSEWLVCSNEGRVFAAKPHSNGWVYGQNCGFVSMPGRSNATTSAFAPVFGQSKNTERATRWMPLPAPPVDTKGVN